MKRYRKLRKWDRAGDEDPAAGLINLFDVWIAFAVALLLSIVSYGNIAKKNASSAPSVHAEEGNKSLDEIDKEGKALERYRPSEQNIGGDGERLGTAYRLKSGEVIYVPDAAK